MAILLLSALPGQAQDRFFLGSRTGWSRSAEVFSEGRYNGKNLFLVIGSRPTAKALHTIQGWKSRTTYGEDLQAGWNRFAEQMGRAAASVSQNVSSLGSGLRKLGSDPVEEVKDGSVLTPAVILFKTTVNLVKAGWYGVAIFGEPVMRGTYGTVACIGSPFIKPATFAGVSLLYSITALYGYTSSAIGGGVLLTATGTVFTIDVATSPITALYVYSQPEVVAD